MIRASVEKFHESGKSERNGGVEEEDARDGGEVRANFEKWSVLRRLSATLADFGVLSP
jgi:hypothetical protein